MKHLPNRILGIFILALLAAISTAAYAGEAAPVTRFTLDNGLEVWYLPRTESESVAVCLTVRAGSRYEEPTQKGISHFLEHAVFEGTDRFNDGRGRLIEIISAKGGFWNAETAEDHTNFWAAIPAAHFDIAAEWVSQLVFHPTLPENKMEQVRSVIFEEKGGKSTWVGRKIDQTGFGGDIVTMVQKRLFPDSSLAWPIIGEDKTLSVISRDQLVAYRAARYIPSNAVLIVVGNVDRQRLDHACATYFADVPKGIAPPPPEAPKLPSEPIHRLVRHAAPGAQGGVLIGVRTTSGNDPDRSALAVLRELLEQSLMKELHFEHGLAYEIHVDTKWYADSGFMLLFAVAKGSKVKRIEAIMQAQIDRIRKGEVDAEKVEAAKTSLTGRWALAVEGNIGWMDWLNEFPFLYAQDQPLPNIASLVGPIKPEDMTRIVNKYFTPERTCVAQNRGFLG